jgi:hypothetical protein
MVLGLGGNPSILGRSKVRESLSALTACVLRLLGLYLRRKQHLLSSMALRSLPLR